MIEEQLHQLGIPKLTGKQIDSLYEKVVSLLKRYADSKRDKSEERISIKITKLEFEIAVRELENTIGIWGDFLYLNKDDGQPTNPRASCSQVKALKKAVGNLGIDAKQRIVRELIEDDCIDKSPTQLYIFIYEFCNIIQNLNADVQGEKPLSNAAVTKANKKQIFIKILGDFFREITETDSLPRKWSNTSDANYGRNGVFSDFCILMCDLLELNKGLGLSPSGIIKLAKSEAKTIKDEDV